MKIKSAAPTLSTRENPALTSRREQFVERLKQLASNRKRITDDLQKMTSKSDAARAVKEAGALAQYAVLAMILEKLFDGVRSHILEKQLEKIGKQEMDFEQKMEQIKLFAQNTQDIDGLGKSVENLEGDKKAEIMERISGLKEIRNSIAEKLGLSPEEISAFENISSNPVFNRQPDASLLTATMPGGQLIKLLGFENKEEGIEASFQNSDGSKANIDFISSQEFAEFVDQDLASYQKLTDENGSIKQEGAEADLLEKYTTMGEDGKVDIKPEFDFLKTRTSDNVLSNIKEALDRQETCPLVDAVKAVSKVSAATKIQ